MPDCPTCGGLLTRRHRTALERPFYLAAYHCQPCDRRIRVRRDEVWAPVLFLVAGHTRCPRCGSTTRLHRINKPDAVDAVSHHPASRLMQGTAAPIYRCSAGRLQYYDWRSHRRSKPVQS